MPPRLELPERALLLYEQIAPEGRDHSGNFRFYVRDDGAFFHARNTRFMPPAAGDPSDEPARFWNVSFEDPVRLLTPEQLEEFERALRDADFPSLESRYAGSPAFHRSNPSWERFTAVVDGSTVSVVVEDRALPPQLERLRACLDRLVEDAPLAG